MRGQKFFGAFTKELRQLTSVYVNGVTGFIGVIGFAVLLSSSFIVCCLRYAEQWELSRR